LALQNQHDDDEEELKLPTINLQLKKQKASKLCRGHPNLTRHNNEELELALVTF
jgi:hypothetical protein